MTPAARLQAAIDILGELEGTAKPVDRSLRDWGRAHRFAGSKDRAAIAELVFSMLRRRSSLAWRMQDDSPRALAIALTGEESLFAGGYGPAPLGDDERARLNAAPREAPDHVKGEYPQFLESELKRAFGDRLPDEMAAMQARAPVDLRVNALKTSREAMLAKLGGMPTPRSPWGIRFPAGVAGLNPCAEFELQDEAAQIACLMSGAGPGMRVLDIAAGAGGKSLALAAMMRNQGEIAAHDISTARLAQIAPRADRAGVTIIREGVPFGRYDLVFVDAPCSGTGTWRRQPELRWRLAPERLAALQATQDALLAQAAAHGPRIVYATCSILPCENDDRIAAFLESHPDFAVEGEPFRASPLSTGTDGFFAAILARRD
ncbi:MAG: RsmB/NOP family class I SAM-dependent RNA methyltransferase [Alphaproteobacteria bacterium]|nr:RsmB/NOP family class I SAM-dependent RNA methyltransferase [Alphaproteobacteria bacterium]